MGSIGISELLMLLLIPVLYVATLVWGYRDAVRRGSNGVLVVVLIALAVWPLSLIIWWMIRSPVEDDLQ
jgi:hypothetical protein